MISTSALQHSSTSPLTVMVRSWLYIVRSCNLQKKKKISIATSDEQSIHTQLHLSVITGSYPMRCCLIFNWCHLFKMIYTEQAYEEIVILVPVSCSIFFRFLPSFPMSLPTRLLLAKIFRGTSSTLIQRQSTQYYFLFLFNNKSENNMRLFAYLHSF